MRLYDILLAKKLSGGGGGEAVLINKNISSNGTYNASTDNADGYKKVVVSVPNTYVAGDEGKVVSNGTLVSQTSETYTTNNTYDTTLINSVTVNVPSGWNPNDVAEETVPSGALVLDTATSIGKYAFASRTGLTSVSAPECLELKERALTPRIVHSENFFIRLLESNLTNEIIKTQIIYIPPYIIRKKLNSVLIFILSVNLIL